MLSLNRWVHNNMVGLLETLTERAAKKPASTPRRVVEIVVSTGM